jgi:hypothetical protein
MNRWTRLLLFQLPKSNSNPTLRSYSRLESNDPFSHPSGSSAAEMFLLWVAPFLPLATSAHPASSGTRKRLVPCRLHSVTKELWFTSWLSPVPTFGWLTAESNHLKTFPAGKLWAERPVQSVPWFCQPLYLAPGRSTKLVFVTSHSFFHRMILVEFVWLGSAAVTTLATASGG